MRRKSRYIVDFGADEPNFKIGCQIFVEGIADGRVRGNSRPVFHPAGGRSAKVGDLSVLEKGRADSNAKIRTGTFWKIRIGLRLRHGRAETKKRGEDNCSALFLHNVP